MKTVLGRDTDWLTDCLDIEVGRDGGKNLFAKWWVVVVRHGLEIDFRLFDSLLSLDVCLSKAFGFLAAAVVQLTRPEFQT